jgi:diguanylate cyclase (GGDEF)-like protein
MIEQLMSGLVNQSPLEKRYIRKDGTIAWVHLSVSMLSDADDQPLCLIGAAHDITKLKNLQQELEIQAHIDYLTGIPNRRYFMEIAEHELARAQRYNLAFAVIMLDIDHFKHINDQFGHNAGDQVLQFLAKLMQKSLREVDSIGRIGGEEFAIILPQTDKERALELAERLHTTIAQTKIPLNDKTTVRITISMGVTVLNDQAITFETLLNQADKGLYQAKSAGRDRIVFSPMPCPEQLNEIID